MWEFDSHLDLVVLFLGCVNFLGCGKGGVALGEA